jgi:hypothetical protein
MFDGGRAARRTFPVFEGELMKFTIRTMASLSALTVACMTFSSHAQTTPAAVDVPKNPCVKPSDYKPIDATSAEMARVTKRVDAYKNCINDYAKGANGKAADLASQAQAYQEAGNQAIDEFNAFVAELNKNNKGGDPSSPDRPKAPAPTSAPSMNRY